MRRLLSSLVLVGLLAAPSLPALARPGHGGGHHGFRYDPGAMLLHHAEVLGLDAATQARLEELAAAGQEEREARRAQMREAKDALHAALAEAQPDEARVMALGAELGSLRAESHLAKLRTLLEMRALLTPEQEERFLAMLEARHERKEARREAMHARLDAAREACRAELAEVAGGRARLARSHAPAPCRGGDALDRLPGGDGRAAPPRQAPRQVARPARRRSRGWQVRSGLRSRVGPASSAVPPGAPGARRAPARDAAPDPRHT